MLSRRTMAGRATQAVDSSSIMVVALQTTRQLDRLFLYTGSKYRACEGRDRRVSIVVLQPRARVLNVSSKKRYSTDTSGHRAVRPHVN